MAESHSFTHWGSTCEEMIKTHFPLHRACRDGDTETLSVLLSGGQHGVYVEDGFYGWTPAHWAAYFGKLSCLMRLHEAGVNCDSATVRLNQTPLHIAAFAGQSHCAKWLLHCGARIDRQLACLRKLMQVTRVGADCDIKSSRFSQTPAHLAAFGGHPQCLQWLLQAGATVDMQDYLGETAVHKAARTGSMECCSLLVSHGARLYICNNNGVTPGDLAKNCGFTECAKYLEAAARHQHSDAKGIYEKQQHNGLLFPSPKDITAAPHIINSCQSQLDTDLSNNHGINDCDMVDVDMDTCQDPGLRVPTCQNGSVTEEAVSNGDITVSLAISTNQLPVAGRKRTRETDDGICSKRQRPADILMTGGKQQPLNGFLTPQVVYANDVNNLHAEAKHLHVFSKSGSLKDQPLESLDIVSGFTNGHSPHVHNGSFHSLKQVMDPSNISSSAEEHANSIILAQGYDSMCCEAMLNTNGTSHF